MQLLILIGDVSTFKKAYDNKNDYKIIKSLIASKKHVGSIACRFVVHVVFLML